MLNVSITVVTRHVRGIQESKLEVRSLEPTGKSQDVGGTNELSTAPSSMLYKPTDFSRVKVNNYDQCDSIGVACQCCSG